MKAGFQIWDGLLDHPAEGGWMGHHLQLRTEGSVCQEKEKHCVWS